MPVIFLIRHGEAENYSPDGRDASRQLSKKGEGDIYLQAKFLLETGDKIDLICHSPFVRAVQTASILESQLHVPLLEDKALTPCGNLESLQFQLKGEDKNIVFVSHLPLIAEFAFSLTGDMVRFLPGTVVKIKRRSIEDCQGRLHWIHHPYENTPTA